MSKQNSADTAIIVGGGPGVSASCARRFAQQGMNVVIAARDPNKAALRELEKEHGVHPYGSDATDAQAVAQLFAWASSEFGAPRLVVHNIDGRVADIFRKAITEADPQLAQQTILNSAYSAFLVGQQAAAAMLQNSVAANGARGTIIFTNASAAFKGYPQSGAFAIASHGKAGLAESMARELMPQGIHVAHVPIDAAIGRAQADGGRGHWLAGETKDDNMADPEAIAELYWQLHQQPRSTWAFEVVLRPWNERW